ncbi:hypothetical protein [Dactylosporangium sp. NPDC005555]|uniref:hypothetical protein n=1 Tax=Dactylosporangium sp. NPDC005555 TaxID=3154889 RepID=UPI0033A7D60D
MANRLRQRLVDDFAAWAGVDDAEKARVGGLLRGRADPTLWRSGDINQLFMRQVAAREEVEPGLAEHGLDDVRGFIRFLDVTDQMHPGSARPAALVKELDRLSAKFPAAMTGKPSKAPAPPEEPARITAGDESAQVGQSALLRDLAALAGWVGVEGRPRDDRGEVRKADRQGLRSALGLRDGTDPVLTALWLAAVEFDVIRLHRTRVTAGPGAGLVREVLAGTAPEREALDLWMGLADMLIHPVTPLHSEKGAEQIRDWLDPWTPLFLDLLSEQDGPAELDGLIDRLLREQAGRLPVGDPRLFAGLAATSVRNILATLARHGAVTVAGCTSDPAREAEAAAWGTTVWAMWPESGTTIELTALGRHLVRRT